MTFRFATTLALLAALAGPASAQEAMTDAERQAFRDEVRAYLLDNPEVLMEAIGILEQREQTARAAAEAQMLALAQDQLINDGYSYVGGNPDGDVTMIEFIDYRCGYCKRAHPEVAELVNRDGNIRYIVKEFPILGDQSVLASQFAIAVKMEAGDDAYKGVNDALMTFQGDISVAALTRISDSFGLQTDAILTRMDTDEVADIIAANRALGAQLQINGTPTFIVEDELLRGYVPLNQMQQIVAQIRG